MVWLDHDLVNDFLRVISMDYGISWLQKLSPDDLMARTIRLLEVSGCVDIVVQRKSLKKLEFCFVWKKLLTSVLFVCSFDTYICYISE